MFHFSRFYIWGTLAQLLKGHKQHVAGGAHPSAGQSPQLNVYFHQDECRENCRQAKRGLCNLVLRRRTAAISVPAPEDSLSDRCVGSY